jgi:ABC-type metal ion transport system, ATPase component
MIELSHISKTYIAPDKKVIALEDVNIRVEEGQIYGIVGYSGAGKSTLVRCINLLEKPDAGTIHVDGFGSIEIKAGNAFYLPEAGGQPVRLNEKHLKSLRRDLGMIFQHFNLLDRDTVFDNVAYPLKHTGLKKEQIRARVLEMLELVDLRDKVNAYPAELSGGQKQRVAIARALANNPKILLSDEATSALDPDATESILKLLKELNRKLNLTIVLITHEMAVVKSICDRVAVMQEGHVVEEGDVYEVFSNPQQAITKKFVNTSSGMGQIDRLIQEHSSVVNADGTLIQCTFSKDSVGEALVSDVSRRFGVDMNIILGNVELLRDNPLGGLVVLVGGEEEKRKAAIEYLRGHDVRVEVIARG